jgi:bifunctional NMN adenylyltransferase/nudix hydrolase
MDIDTHGTVGVIVARFQVPELHAGHRWLLAEVFKHHDNVLIALGDRKSARSKLYPLTFEEREVMIRQAFPEQTFLVKPVYDHPFSNIEWSKRLDALIRETFPGQKAILCGSRGSFIPKYEGSFPTRELVSTLPDSGTAHREALAFPHTRDGRAAIIYEMQNRFPFIYSTSDLAIIERRSNYVLLIGKKQHGGLLSFVGGHAEKTDSHGRMVAEREGGEEVLDIRMGEPVYIDTVAIDDPRYRGTPDGVMTTFYRAEYEGGTASPGSDADFVQWVLRDRLNQILVPWHQPLGALLNEKWPSAVT